MLWNIVRQQKILASIDKYEKISTIFYVKWIACGNVSIYIKCLEFEIKI